MELENRLPDNPMIKHAVMSIVSGEYSHFNAFMKTHEHSSLLKYLALAVFLSPHSESFLHRLMTRPEDVIRQSYLPFIANTREDFKYQTILLYDKQFVRYRCRTCGEIHCITDCGKITAKRNRDGMNLGGIKCDCGAMVGSSGEANSERIDLKPCRRGLFTTDLEASRGYVCLEPTMVEGLKIRKLSKVCRKMGDLILHACLLLVFGYSHEFHRTLIADTIVTQHAVPHGMRVEHLSTESQWDMAS